jgi:hypothetical protein
VPFLFPKKIHQQSCRYVAELLKMRETFINPLLHPYVNSSLSTTPENDHMSQVETLVESALDHLPIASRFLSSPTAGSDGFDGPEDNGRARMISRAFRRGGQASPKLATERDPRSPLPSQTPRDSFVSIARSHLSLRLPSRPNRKSISTATLGRRCSVESSPTERDRPDRDRGRRSKSTDTSAQGMRQKSKESFTRADLIHNGGVAPRQIPDDLRQCLKVIEERILSGHVKFSECLRKRYNEQYPLVRSLADVFMANVRYLPLFLPRLSTQLDSSYTSSAITQTTFCI